MKSGARELVEEVLDDGSWRSWDEPVADPGPPDPGYAADLARARERTGLDEAVITGEGTIEGHRVAVAACEFGFLAGSIGVAAAERLVRAVERATERRLPVLAAPTSGGTRMQEGTVAFLQMVKISTAVARHRAAGLPYLVYLRHPTTGGVFASWGSLGHVAAAEPGALIGFLGPRVYESLYGTPFPAGVQVAENLHACGLVDAVVPPAGLRAAAGQVLRVLAAPREPLPAKAAVPADPAGTAVPAVPVPAWESVVRSRRDTRPGAGQLLQTAARDVTPLRGTGAGESEPGLRLALARFGPVPCVVIAQDRARQASRPIGPAGFREARRGMRLAAELGLALVTVVDTGGAALSRQAEEGGLAGEIARCLAELVVLAAPTLCVLLGQGAGGGALALLPADRVVAAQHAWLSPLPPEGASAILYRTTDRAATAAQRQGIASADLHAAGIVDRIVPERPDAADEPAGFLRRLAGVVEDELGALLRAESSRRLADRFARYRRIGLS